MQGFRLRVWGFRASKAWCTLLSGFSAQGRTQFLGLVFVEGGCRRGDLQQLSTLHVPGSISLDTSRA